MIRTAILLAAGEGSRLREAGPSKPLCPVGGVALLDHALKGLAQAGLGRAIVVTGYRADGVEAHLAGRNTPLPVETVRTPDWRLPNGVSARAAGALVGVQPALLAMCDHLVDPALYRRMADAGAGQGLRLGVDRRLGHPWIDPDDVTCVETDGTRIVAIGKGIEPHNAYDTGVFAVTTPFFDVLERLESPSISMAVGVLAEYRRAETVDCSDLDWIDVDDPRAMAQAAAWLSGQDQAGQGHAVLRKAG